MTIDGKFYPLQPEEWLEACRKLNPSELKLLYYLRTADPYDRGIEINCAAIARDLSVEGKKAISRQTISRALKGLDKHGYIDLEIVSAKVKIHSKGALTHHGCADTPRVHEDTNGCNNTPQGTTTHPKVHEDTTVCVNTPQGTTTHQTRAENLDITESQNSKINKTNKTNKTNKDLEREEARAQNSDPWEDPDLGQQENDPDWPEIDKSDPEEETSPARVDPVINKYDRVFVEGRSRRRKNIQLRADEAVINPEVWTVEESEEFFRLATVHFMALNPHKTQGQAMGIIDGWHKQINSQAIRSPQAREYYRLYRQGLLGKAKATTALEINNNSAFDAAFAAMED